MMNSHNPLPPAQPARRAPRGRAFGAAALALALALPFGPALMRRRVPIARNAAMAQAALRSCTGALSAGIGSSISKPISRHRQWP